MPITYDQRDSCILEDFGLPDPTEPGWERFSNGAFRRVDGQGVYDPRTVWQAPHTNGRLLAHLMDDWVGGSAYVTVVGQPFITQRIYYADVAKTQMMASVSYTRNANQQCTQKVTRVYASDGVTVTATCTETFTFDANGFANGVSRVIS